MRCTSAAPRPLWWPPVHTWRNVFWAPGWQRPDAGRWLVVLMVSLDDRWDGRHHKRPERWAPGRSWLERRVVAWLPARAGGRGRSRPVRPSRRAHLGCRGDINAVQLHRRAGWVDAGIVGHRPRHAFSWTNTRLPKRLGMDEQTNPALGLGHPGGVVPGLLRTNSTRPGSSWADTGVLVPAARVLLAYAAISSSSPWTETDHQTRRPTAAGR